MRFVYLLLLIAGLARRLLALSVPYITRGRRGLLQCRPPQGLPSLTRLTSTGGATDDDDEQTSGSIVSHLASTVSQRASMKANRPYIQVKSAVDRGKVQFITFLRVAVPSILAGVAATCAFPGLAITLATVMNDAGVFAVLSQDSSQFVQNFLTVSSLLFSILVGQT